MEFRKYQENDAKEILKWIKNEREFRLWSARRYENYPIIPELMNEEYKQSSRKMEFHPMTLVEDGKIVGHIVVRIPEEDKTAVRFGFIIVDNNIRGKGYGKKLISEAINYVKENFNVERITLGVFTANESAMKCYESVGFNTVEIYRNFMSFEDENWDCAEMALKLREASLTADKISCTI